MTASTASQRILVYLVDDDDDGLHMIESKLSGYDHAFLFKIFRSPREALKAFPEDVPDVVICDYLFGMEADGLAFLRTAREKGFSTPFIFLSGQASEETVEKILRGGAEDFFLKGSDPTHFIRLAAATRRAAEHHQTSKQMKELSEELHYLNNEVNSFFSMTSHELRNPLTNIEGFSQLLLEKLNTLTMSDIKDFVARIEGNATKLHMLINDLLLFSRERKRKISYETVYLANILREVTDNLTSLIESTHAEINMHVNVESIPADRQKLSQIMKNLLENALIYHREGVDPSISFEINPYENGYILFKISDNGRGIPQTEWDTIFEIFRRGSSSRNIQGTGVGLALIDDNISKMGGKIWLESTPGSGSTFFFLLPGEKDEPKIP